LPDSVGHEEEENIYKCLSTFYVVIKMWFNPKNLKNQLANAGIRAGLAFFTTLAGITIAQIFAEPAKALIASGISAGLTFFASLVAERQLGKFLKPCKT